MHSVYLSIDKEKIGCFCDEYLLLHTKVISHLSIYEVIKIDHAGQQ